jgi:copper resistance protein C
MSHAFPTRVLRAAGLLAVTLLVALPSLAVAHAEFVSSVPEDGETVEGSPNFVRATFSEELADGSEMALVDETGAILAEGGIDPANPSRLRMEPPDLEPGDYEVQWKAFADDGHLETGTFSFTVSAPITPPPSLEPTPSSPVTAAPTASESPPPVGGSITPSPTEGDVPPSNAAGANDVLFPIVAAIVLVAVLGGYLVLRRRPTRP